MVTNKAYACKIRQMLFPPTLGFRMEQYLLSVHTTVHVGESGSGWVADTLEDCKPSKGMKYP
jgi:hypothetical protein